MLFYEDFANGKQYSDPRGIRNFGSDNNGKRDCKTRFLACVTDVNFGRCKAKTLTLCVNEDASDDGPGRDESISIAVKSDREAAFIAPMVFEMMRNGGTLFFAVNMTKQAWMDVEDRAKKGEAG